MKISEFLKKLQELDQEQLAQKNGIGQVIIDSLTLFLESTRYRNLLEGFQKLDNQGIRLTLFKKDVQANLILAGKTAVITGTMDISRTILKEKLENLGIKVASSVTKKTDFLLAGQSSGSKVKIAESLGVPIIEINTEKDFQKFLDTPRDSHRNQS